jgi:threonine dehydratase
MNPISLDEIEQARKRIAESTLRAPLVHLGVDDDAPADIYLKLENLQPTGSFKARGAGNAIALLSDQERSQGVYTCSAGNMAQALAWHARRNRIPCTVIVPDTAPETKLQAIKRFDAKIIQLPWDGFWQVATTHHYAALEGSAFIHPFADRRMIAANGTIGLEILEDIPNVDSVVIPFGGGGLATGIATAIKGRKHDTRVYACETETAAPLAASFAAGSAQAVKRIPSFVDGIGAENVLSEMWELVQPLLDGSVVVSLHEIVSAIGLLFERNRVIAEGAGAASVAAALTGKAGAGRVVCVVSGGNIDLSKLVKILHGEIP